MNGRRSIILVDSEWHNHQIVPWAVEEKCFHCQYPASHKVIEEFMNGFHPFTAYVCCNHFWAGCRNVRFNEMTIVTCIRCRTPYNMDMESALPDSHFNPRTGRECNPKDDEWHLEVVPYRDSWRYFQ